VSALCGVLTYPDPATQTPGGRLGVRIGSAALSGFVTWVGLRDLQDDFFRRPLRAGLTAVAIGATLGLADASDAVDAKLHRGLIRRGVARPRAVLAAASAILMVVAAVSGRSRSAPVSEPDGSDVAEETTVEMPEDVRRLIDALLAATESWGAPQLRVQLAAARVIEYLGEDEDAFYPGIGFEVPDGLPRAVPHDTRFPVAGRYHPLDGRSADVTLTIADGKLAHLSIAPGADWTPDDEIVWMDAGGSIQDIDRWPAPDELVLLLDTVDGPQARA
jgi:hypothetical protein